MSWKWKGNSYVAFFLHVNVIFFPKLMKYLSWHVPPIHVTQLSMSIFRIMHLLLISFSSNPLIFINIQSVLLHKFLIDTFMSLSLMTLSAWDKESLVELSNENNIRPVTLHIIINRWEHFKSQIREINFTEFMSLYDF